MEYTTITIRVPKVGRRLRFSLRALFAVTLLAAVFASGWIAHRSYERARINRVPTVATQAILVATKDISFQGRLDVSNVKLEEWPLDRLPAGPVVDVAELDGFVTRSRVYAGEPIQLEKVTKQSTGNGE